MKKENNYQISRKEFARIIGITDTSVKGWETTHGFSECYTDGKIDLGKASKRLYELWTEARDNDEEPKVSSPALERKRLADAEKAEIQIALIKETLVRKDEWLQAESERLAIIRDAIMELADILAGPLALTDEQKKMVKQKCRSVLMRTKETFKEKSSLWTDFINGAA